jgi:DNA-binding LacI/PurR family transcriptional regulator
MSSVDQCPEELGRLGVRRIFERVQNPQLPAERILIPGKLVARASSIAAA